MGNLEQEIRRWLILRKSWGQESVWLSEANRSVLRSSPLPRYTSPPAPPAKPRFAPARGAEISRPPAQETSSPKVATTIPPGDFAALGWEELILTAQNCRACPLAEGRQQVVFGEGHQQARLMFIGEGPGEEEDQQGRPFVGRAGQMLSNMIKAMGFERNSPEPRRAVYIANIVKCRPPHNRNPLESEVASCLPLLQRQIALLRPQVMVLLGAVPLRCLMGLVGINKHRGTWLDYQGSAVMPTFHPAYLLRFEQQKNKFIEEKRKVWEDLQQVMARLKALDQSV